jgi:hypothetical protein
VIDEFLGLNNVVRRNNRAENVFVLFDLLPLISNSRGTGEDNLHGCLLILFSVLLKPYALIILFWVYRRLLRCTVTVCECAVVGVRCFYIL